MILNLHAAWIGFLLGCFAGLVPGLFFHQEIWLGGYAAWPRRMIRLGHVAFFGIGFINLAFVLTARALDINSGLSLPSVLLLIAAVAMPLVCYLSAYRKIFQNFFFVPALALTGGVAVFLGRILIS